jgi:hypothetical protein
MSVDSNVRILWRHCRGANNPHEPIAAPPRDAMVERMLGHKLSTKDRVRFKEEWEAACENWFIAHSPPSVRRAASKKRR